MGGAIFACRDPRSSRWQLGLSPPAIGRLTLIGWGAVPITNDADLPEGVVSVLARALAASARVTFPCSTVGRSTAAAWSMLGEDQIRTLGKVVLVSTRSPETTALLFRDPGFPWWLQGQAVLLSSVGAAPPDISRRSFLALFDEKWMEQAALLASCGVDGILRPGVDGALAGVFSLTGRFEQALLTALKEEAQAQSFDWSLLSEEAFAEALARP